MKVHIKNIYIHVLVTLLFAVAAWAFWAFVYPAHLHMWEQLQCFEYTWGYMADALVKPAGVAEYVSRFLTQFFYVGSLGPVVLAAVLLLVYHSAFLLTKTSDAGIVAKHGFAMVPALLSWAFLVSIDAKLTLPVALCMTLYAVWATMKLTLRAGVKLFVPAIAMLIMAVILAFTVGSVFVVYIVLMLVALLRQMKADGKLVWKWGLGCTLYSVALWFAVVNLLSVCYPYPKDLLMWGGYYNRFCYVDADYNVSTWCWTIGAIAASMLLPALMKSKAMKIACGVMAVTASATCAYFVSQSIDNDEESLLENMYLMRNAQWNEIINRSKVSQPTTSYEQCPLNLALAMRGQLADRFFAMRQYGMDGLLPRYQMDYMTPLLAADAYYEMSMINTAQRFYYESMESIADHQKSAHLLKRLTMTALANGRVNLAKSYIHKLKNTLYYREWAKEMEKYADNPSLMDKHAELARLRSQRTKQESFFNDNDPTPYIGEMLNCNTNNDVAWQYLFTMLMVQGRLDELMQAAQVYTQHFEGRMLPVHVQEALLYTWVTKTGALNGFPWRVSTNIGQRFMQFAQSANQSREVAEPIVRREFGDTFWCYAVFKNQEQKAQPQLTPDASTGASQQAYR